MYLFIDANIFLSFYHLTSEDLEELEKLAVLIENKEITLLLPEQLIDETWRNREGKIKDSFETFKKAKFNLAFPAYCKDYEQYLQMRDLLKKIEDTHSDIVTAIQAGIDSKKLAADILITRLFSIAKKIPRTPEIILKARERAELGNPPGKKGSLGDAINWESLLSSAPSYLNLHFVADDSDFYSPLDSSRFNDFLDSEWRASKTHSKIFFYRKISAFFKAHYPNINLQTEIEKDGLIEALAASFNFATTHSIIAELSKHDGFTNKQVEDLVAALLSNNQVKWIASDEDVNDFYKKLFDDHILFLHDDAEELMNLLKIKDDEIDKLL